jgi:hypothetical protein
MVELNLVDVAKALAAVQTARASFRTLGAWSNLPSAMNEACLINERELALAQAVLQRLLGGTVQVHLDSDDSTDREEKRGLLSIFGGKR